MSLRGFVLPLLVAALVTFVTAASAASASATTLTVNTTTDSTGSGQCSLREAIDAVDSPGAPNSGCPAAAFGSNTIVLPVGNYQLAFPGQLSIFSTVTNLTIQGAGAGKTTVDDLGSDRLFQVAPGATVAMNDLTLNGGRAASGTPSVPAGSNGGAILNHGVLTLTDVGITNSTAGLGYAPPGSAGGTGGPGGLGGAIYNGGALILNGVSITSDQAGSGGYGGGGGTGTTDGTPGGDGGAGGSGGGVASTGLLTIVTSTFGDDSAGDGGGGGMGGGATSTGTGGDGGAGALGGDGGAVAVLGGTFQITNSTFASNSAGNGGPGGIGGGATQTGGNGGAGGNGGTGGTLYAAVAGGVQSATLAGNHAGNPGVGGSAGNGSPSGTPGAGGSLGSGGGVAAPSAAVTLQNSLIAESSNGNCSGSVVDGGHDLSFDGSGCPNTFASGNPNLGALQNNGGPTRTIALQPGSAAIDQVPAKGAACQATDQRGVRRPSGSACDIGAYEVAPPSARTTAAEAAGKTAETLTATITPNAGAATVTFLYGTTNKTTSNSKTVHTSGVVATPLKVTVRGLHPGKRYYYKVTVQAPDGSATGSIRSFKTAPKPAIQSLHVSPSSFRSAGATVTYTDTASGRTKVEVLKPERKHRFKVVAHTTHQDRAGKRQRVHVSGHHLAKGSYVVKVIGSAGQSASAKVHVL